MGAAGLTRVREALPEQAEQGVGRRHDGERDGRVVEQAERREQRTGETERAGEVLELCGGGRLQGCRESAGDGDDEAGDVGWPVDHVSTTLQ